MPPHIPNSSWRSWRKLGVLAVFLLPLVLLDAFVIEPNWITITERELNVLGLERPLRLLLMSDLHIHSRAGTREAWIEKRVRGWNADAIVVAGDMFDRPEAMIPAAELLARLSRQAPVHVVLGNWEYWSGADLSVYRSKLSAAGIHLLENDARSFRHGSQTVSILGVGDLLNGQDELAQAVARAAPGSRRILLAHEPVVFEDAAKAGIPLVLAGHTHGGQVALPFWGPLWLPSGCHPYLYGVYTSGGSRMVVTKGVGNSILPVRFWCRPEVVLLTVR